MAASAGNGDPGQPLPVVAGALPPLAIPGPNESNGSPVSVPEMPIAGEDHGHAVSVRRFDHGLIPD